MGRAAVCGDGQGGRTAGGLVELAEPRQHSVGVKTAVAAVRAFLRCLFGALLFAALARACHALAVDVDANDALQDAFVAALSADRPTVIICHEVRD